MLKKCLKRAAVDAAMGEDEVVVEAVNVEGGELVPGVGLDVGQVDVTEVGVLFVLVVSAAVLGKAGFSWWCCAVGPQRTLRPFDGCLVKTAAGFCRR